MSGKCVLLMFVVCAYTATAHDDSCTCVRAVGNECRQCYGSCLDYGKSCVPVHGSTECHCPYFGDTDVVYFAPGGCDVSDKTCVPARAPASQEIRSFVWHASPDGTIKPLQSVDTGGAATWLTLKDECLFSVLSDKSRILSYHKNSTGHLALVSNLTSVGLNPVFIDVLSVFLDAPKFGDAASQITSVLVAANYHGGDSTTQPKGAGVTSLLVDRHCKLTPGDFFAVTGSGPDKSRQGTAHVHSVVMDASRKNDGIFLACDLGSDRIYTFEADTEHTNTLGKLTLKGNFSTEPGSGPRHVAVSARHKLAYVLHEMGNFITVHNIKGDVGGADWLKQMQKIELMPQKYTGFSKAAEIILNPSQTAVFATNRGYGSNVTNTVVGFNIKADGTLVAASRTAAPAYPRGMQISPDGGTLVVAGQSTGSVMAMVVGQGGKVTASRTLLHPGDLATPTTVVISAHSNTD